MVRTFVFFTLIIAICVSCSKDHQDVGGIVKDDDSAFFIKLISQDGTEYTPCVVNDSMIHVPVGKNVDLQSLGIRFGKNYKDVKIDGADYKKEEQFDFSDFLNPHHISFTDSVGVSRKGVILIYNLPVITIDTPDERLIDSKTEKVQGCKLALYDGANKTYEGTAGVEGRGNSTWELPKKPYNIKLDKKCGFFELPQSKQWILLANAFWDRTQMHNAIAYEMARLTDYPWVQSGDFVELILNGRHQGLYYLCEKIKVESGRIDIRVMDSTASQINEMDGGYLIETAFFKQDNTFQTDFFNLTDLGSPLYWEIKKPDENLSDIQISYIKSEIDRLERLLLNEDSVKAGVYRDYLDIESAINWMLVNEVSCNQETQNPSNLFLYRDMGGMLKFGPPWDFDAHTFGVYGENKIFLQRPTFYFHWMLKDPIFVDKLKYKWSSYKDVWLQEIPPFIDKLYSCIYLSAIRNEKMWPDWHYLYQYPDKDYRTIIDEMKSFFVSQVRYVDGVINSL